MARPPAAHEPGLGADPARHDARRSTRRRLTRAESQVGDAHASCCGRPAGLFLRDGFVATSLADIAAAAGVTKGAVYSNFAEQGGPVPRPAGRAGIDVGDVRPAPARRHRRRWRRAASRPARQFGRHAERVRPSRAHVALFLEANAVALRSERARASSSPATPGRSPIELGTRPARAVRRPRRRSADARPDRPVAVRRAADARCLPRRGRRRHVRDRVRGSSPPRPSAPPAR